MSNRSAKISVPTKFNLSPLGKGTVTQVLHEGKMFHLYCAELNERDVVLKTPSPSLSGDSLFVRSILQGSETFVSTNQGIKWLNQHRAEFDPIKVATWALLVESQIINQTAGAWNHEVIAMGTWDGLSECWHEEIWNSEEPLDFRFLPVMVMPYHDAVAFSTLPHTLKRLLLPKMLPALWDALLRMPHGDLSESNILINQTQNIFHLIDPGVVLTSDTQQFNGLSYISIFTTTAANYPVIPPFNRQSYETSGLISFIEKPIVQNYLKEPILAGEKLSTPAACDLLALGIIYYRILTGKEMFLGTSILPQKPAWMNSYMTPAFEDRRVYNQLIDSLSNNYIQKELEKAGILDNEKRLALGLLNLEVVDREHLLYLSAV